MTNGSTKTRYCIVEPAGGNVSIKLSVSKEIMAGGDFKLYSENKQTVMEQWKLSAENNSYELKKIKTYTRDLNKCHLIWSILSCSLNPQVYHGEIALSFLQGESDCVLTPPARWNLTNIPPCKINATQDLSGSLQFIIKT